MTPNQVDCFLAVVKHGNITAAAKAMFLSPQVISQHISQLEKELDVSLFQRRRSGMELTSYGQEFYDFSVRWIGMYNHTLKSISELYNNLSLHFRIGISEYIDTLGIISGSIADFAHSHSSTDIRCEQQGNHILLEKLHSGELDIAIVCETQMAPGADLEVEPVAAEDLRLYISGVEDIDPNLKPDSPELREILQTLPHVDTPYGHWNTFGWKQIAKRMNSFLGLPSQSDYSVPNFRSVLACIHMIPCAIVCDSRFGFIRAEDGIFNIPLNVESNICCVWSKQNENPLIQEFVDHLKWYYSTEPKANSEEN